MSTKLKAGTSTSGAVLDADTTGILELQSGSTPTTAVTIDTSQNVGIGTTTPDYKLVVDGEGSAGGFAIKRTGTLTGSGSLRLVGSSGSEALGFSVNATERMRITSAGSVGIGSAGDSTVRLMATGSDSTSSNYALRAENSGTFALFYARNDGVINTGARTNSPYNLTTGSAANMYVDSAGTLYRSTSSLKYKTDVQDAIHGLEDLLKLRSVTYKQKNSDADGNKSEIVFGGLIAEEVNSAGLTEFVQYADDGTPDALAYSNMVSLCVKAIQELNAKVDAQALEIQALKGAA
jgi:hypothetical protein